MRPAWVASPALAPVLEVFSSIQGEGAFVGAPQVFLRLAGCPLRCRWCDTPGSWRIDRERSARIFGREGERAEPGWVSAAEAARWVEELDPHRSRALSITGGEPLMWPDFVLELCAELVGRRAHLETAGAHPLALERVMGALDHLSLDLKLPLDMDAPEELRPPAGRLAAGFERSPASESEWRDARRAVLALVRGRDAVGKVVVAAGREPELFDPLLRDVAELAPALPIVLQPATAVRGVGAPRVETLLALAERALALGLAVRVLPQLHPLLGLR